MLTGMLIQSNFNQIPEMFHLAVAIPVFCRDDVNSFTVTRQILDELELVTHTEQDYRLVRHVCSLVSRRAAFLASAGNDFVTVQSVFPVSGAWTFSGVYYIIWVYEWRSG